jgi:hypothetical protein
MVTDKESTEADSDQDTDMNTGTDMDIYLMNSSDNHCAIVTIIVKIYFC